MMMEDSMFGKLAAETNSYAALCQREKGTDDKLWTPTDVVEMKAFVGLSMLMGINPMHEYADYWSGEPFIENAAIKRIMTMNRYGKGVTYCRDGTAHLQVMLPAWMCFFY